MVETYHPLPWQSPTPDGAQRPLSVQISYVLPPDAGDQDVGTLSHVAQNILAAQSGALDRFIAINRQQASISKLTYADRFLKFDSMEARWRLNYNTERLDVRVFPTGGGATQQVLVERNLDGYVAWIYCEPNHGSTGTASTYGPFDIYMNGYLIEHKFAPDLSATRTGGYVMLFGKTALRAQSYVGSVEHKNPLTKNPLLAQPLVVVPPPSWGDYAAGTGPDGATPQAAIPKELGYWLFDWDNPHNPFQFTTIPYATPSPTNAWAATPWYARHTPGFQQPGDPTVTMGKYFPDPTRSPLKPAGMNGVSVFPALDTSGYAQETYSMVVAEFYDRGKYRVVTQSWTHPARGGSSFKVNDSPLLYAGYVSGEGYVASANIDAQFDLSPERAKEGPNGNDTLIGPHDHAYNVQGVTLYTAGLTPDQIAKINKWNQDYNAEYSAFSAPIIQQIVAIDAQIDAVETRMTTYITNIGTEISNSNIVSLFGQTETQRLYISIVDNPTSANPDYNTVLPYMHDGSFSSPNNRTNFLNDTANLAAAQAQVAAFNAELEPLDAQLANPPPKPPPPDLGGDISGFNPQTITINGDNWSFA